MKKLLVIIFFIFPTNLQALDWGAAIKGMNDRAKEKSDINNQNLKSNQIRLENLMLLKEMHAKKLIKKYSDDNICAYFIDLGNAFEVYNCKGGLEGEIKKSKVSKAIQQAME